MSADIESVPLKQPDSLIAPLLAWLVVQLAALAFICFRVPLWAKHPQPPDAMAAATMLIVQNVAAAILFPLLFRSVKSSLVVAATAWPMLFAAGAIASVPSIPLLLAGTHQTAIFAAFCLWGILLKSRAAAMGGSAVALTLLIGPAVLEYLRLEFNSGATLLAPIWRLTPLSVGIEALSGSVNYAGWTVLALLAILPASLIIFRWWTAR